ncbi:MAG: hypothetical protein PHU63_00260 [Candidatus ainarchaeum sp.]|nr:hypothetical protein [Candidatus ainarchaeum sp.]
MKNENYRQYIHMAATLLVLLFMEFFGRTGTVLMLILVLLVGSLIINIKIIKNRIPLIDGLINLFERDNPRFVGYGSAWLVVGCLLTITFLSDINQIKSVIWILGIGDGMSTLVGIKSRKKLPYNKKKTINGSVAMFLSSIPVYFLIGPMGVLIAAACTIIESIELPINDNASIPLIGIIILKLFV